MRGNAIFLKKGRNESGETYVTTTGWRWKKGKERNRELRREDEISLSRLRATFAALEIFYARPSSSWHYSICA